MVCALTLRISKIYDMHNKTGRFQYKYIYVYISNIRGLYYKVKEKRKEKKRGKRRKYKKKKIYMCVCARKLIIISTYIIYTLHLQKV